MRFSTEKCAHLPAAAQDNGRLVRIKGEDRDAE
jgi:hypothetical protein